MQENPISDDILITPEAISLPQNISLTISRNGHAYVVSNGIVEVFRDPEMTEHLCTIRKSGTIYYAESCGISLCIWFADQEGAVLNGYISPSALEDLVLEDETVSGMIEYDPVSFSIGDASIILFRTEVDYLISQDEYPETVTAGSSEIIIEPSVSGEGAPVSDKPDDIPEIIPDNPDESTDDKSLRLLSDTGITPGSGDPITSSAPDISADPADFDDSESVGRNLSPGTDEITPNPISGNLPDNEIPDLSTGNIKSAQDDTETVPQFDPVSSDKNDVSIAKNSGTEDPGESTPASSDTEEPLALSPDDIILTPGTNSTIEPGGFAELPAGAELYNCQNIVCGIVQSRCIVRITDIEISDGGVRYLVEYWSDTIDDHRIFAEGYVYDGNINPTDQEDYSLIEKERIQTTILRSAKRGSTPAYGYARIGNFRSGRIINSVQYLGETAMASGAYLWDDDGKRPIPIYALNGDYELVETTLYGFFRVEQTNSKAVLKTGPYSFMPGRAYTISPHPVQYIYALVGDRDRKGSMEYRMLITRSDTGTPVSGFVKATPVMSGTSIRFESDGNSPFISPEEEDFGILSAVDPPVESAAGLIKCWGVTGLFCETDETGIRRYLLYGVYPGGTPGFVPADSAGRMIPGKLPVIYTTKQEESSI